MRSIRTDLSPFEKKDFQKFLIASGMVGVHVGDYTMYINDVPAYRLCYAFSEKDENISATMTLIRLKFGDMEKAFRAYMIRTYK